MKRLIPKALLILACICLAPLGLRAEVTNTANTITEALITQAYRQELLRNPISSEFTSWTAKIQQDHFDPSKLRDVLRHSPEGWNVRHFRRGMIHKTLGVTLGMLGLLAGLALATRSRGIPIPGIARATGILLVFLLVSGVLINILLLYSDRFPVLAYADDLFRNPTHLADDSWQAIIAAANEPFQPCGQSLYQLLLTNRNIKFQYPLTSTLLVIPFRNGPITGILNGLSFIAAWGIAMMTAFLFAQGLRLAVTGPPPAKPATTKTVQRVWSLILFILAAGYTFTYFPILRGLLLGQVQTVIVALFCGALLSYVHGRKASAGVLIGLACTIKPQLGFLLLWGLLRKEFRFVGWALLTGAVMGVAAIGVYGLHNNLDYIRVLRFVGSHGEAYFANQSLNGLLNRAFFLGSNLDWDGVVYPAYNVWVSWGTSAGALGFALWALLWKRPSSQRNDAALIGVDFAMAALAATLGAPIAWEHHYGLLLPMFALAFPLTLTIRDKAGLVLLALSFILVSHFFIMANLLAETRLNVLQSYIFFGGILFMIQLHRLRKNLALPAH